MLFVAICARDLEVARYCYELFFGRPADAVGHP
jgi:hypothetical protein